MGLLDRIAGRLGYTASRDVPARVRQAVDQVVRDYSLAWPSPMLWGLFGGAGSSTGVPVTPLSALQSAAVYACVRRKSEDIAKLPILVERDVGGGDWQRDRDHPFNNVLARPNRWMTPFEFWRYVVASMDLRGNGIVAIKRGWDGSPEELIPLNWDRVSVLLSPNGLLFYNVSHPQIGWGVTFHQDDVLHFRGLTLDGGYLGITPIAAAQDVVGLSIATQQHGAVLFRQGAQVSGVIKHPGKLSKEAIERIRQSWQDVYGGVQNAAKTAVLEEGMTFEKLTMTNEDSQFLQTRAFQVIEICRMFGVPPHKVYDLSKANFSTLEQQEQAYVNDTLDTLATNLQDGTNAKVFFEDERHRYRIRFDFGALLRGDQKTRADFYGSALNNGWLSVNDVRRREGLPPIEGGDTYRVPVNTQPVAEQPSQDVSPSGNDEPPAASAGIGSQAMPPGSEPIEAETADQALV